MDHNVLNKKQLLKVARRIRRENEKLKAEVNELDAELRELHKSWDRLSKKYYELRRTAAEQESQNITLSYVNRTLRSELEGRDIVEKNRDLKKENEKLKDLAKRLAGQRPGDGEDG